MNNHQNVGAFLITTIEPLETCLHCYLGAIFFWLIFVRFEVQLLFFRFFISEKNSHFLSSFHLDILPSFFISTLFTHILSFPCPFFLHLFKNVCFTFFNRPFCFFFPYFFPSYFKISFCCSLCISFHPLFFLFCHSFFPFYFFPYFTFFDSFFLALSFLIFFFPSLFLPFFLPFLSSPLLSFYSFLFLSFLHSMDS